VVAVVLSVFYLTLDDYLETTATRAAADNHAHRARIVEFARANSEAPRKIGVIALGDSALRNATFFDSEMDAFARAIGGPGIRFLRITHARAMLHDYLALFEAIFEARPDLLLIQAWTIPDRSNRNQRRRHRTYRAGGVPSFDAPRAVHLGRLLRGRQSLQHQSYLADRILSSFGGRIGPRDGLGNRYALRQREIICNPEFTRRVIDIRNATDSANPRRGLDPSAMTTIDLLLQQAAAVGVTIAFVEIPMAAELADLPGVRRKTAAQERLFAIHAAAPAFRYWPFEAEVPDDGFCDAVHLSPLGRDVYSRWLIERIGNAAQARGGS
jgi:hypothetical protein